MITAQYLEDGVSVDLKVPGVSCVSLLSQMIVTVIFPDRIGKGSYGHKRNQQEVDGQEKGNLSLSRIHDEAKAENFKTVC